MRQKKGSLVLRFGLVLGILGLSTVTEAAAKAEVVEGKYIVVLKEAEFAGIQQLSSAGESVEQMADRLVEEARQHQLDVDMQRGVARSAGVATSLNQRGLVFQHALKGFSANLSTDAADMLRQRPEVAYIEPDIRIHASALQAAAPSWGLDRIDQRDLPLDEQYAYELDGNNVHIYVLDSGIRATHQEFRNRVGDGYDAIDSDTDPDDCNGHGTHVSGTAAGLEYGVAKSAVVHPVRVLDCEGSGLYSQVIAGIDWVAANRQRPAVANMSLGGPAAESMDTAVNNAIAAGVTFVIAAGNDTANACDNSPGRVPAAITVGATDRSDQRAPYSNIGVCVDLFAPGSLITSAWFFADMATQTLEGTSMAAPHVTGVAALYLEDNPEATPAQVAAALVAASTKNKVTDPGALTPNRLLYNEVTTPESEPHPWLPWLFWWLAW